MVGHVGGDQARLDQLHELPLLLVPVADPEGGRGQLPEAVEEAWQASVSQGELLNGPGGRRGEVDDAVPVGGRRLLDGGGVGKEELQRVPGLSLCSAEGVLEPRAGAVRLAGCEAGQQRLQVFLELGAPLGRRLFERLHGLDGVAGEFVHVLGEGGLGRP